MADKKPFAIWLAEFNGPVIKTTLADGPIDALRKCAVPTEVEDIYETDTPGIWNCGDHGVFDLSDPTVEQKFGEYVALYIREDVECYTDTQVGEFQI